MADNELAAKLNRQQQRADGEIAPAKVSQSVYAEFKEFSIPEIKEFRKTFQKYDKSTNYHNNIVIIGVLHHAGQAILCFIQYLRILVAQW